MPMRSQGYCGDGRGLSGLRWRCRNGRGPYLEGRQEPQASSLFLTPTLRPQGAEQSWNAAPPNGGPSHATVYVSVFNYTWACVCDVLGVLDIGKDCSLVTIPDVCE